jgi:hypothetical protein
MQEEQANLNNMAMLSLSRAVLLMRMRTRNEMGDAYTLKERVKFFILTSPISLHSKNFLIKESFYMLLEITEFLKDIRFRFQEIDPSELAIIINKAHIIFKTTNRF